MKTLGLAFVAAFSLSLAACGSSRPELPRESATQQENSDLRGKSEDELLSRYQAARLVGDDATASAIAAELRSQGTVDPAKMQAIEDRLGAIEAAVEAMQSGQAPVTMPEPSVSSSSSSEESVSTSTTSTTEGGEEAPLPVEESGTEEPTLPVEESGDEEPTLPVEESGDEEPTLPVEESGDEEPSSSSTENE